MGHGALGMGHLALSEVEGWGMGHGAWGKQAKQVIGQKEEGIFFPSPLLPVSPSPPLLTRWV